MREGQTKTQTYNKDERQKDSSNTEISRIDIYIYIYIYACAVELKTGPILPFYKLRIGQFVLFFFCFAFCF